MVYIALTNPHFGVVLGDQYLSWIPGGMLPWIKNQRDFHACLCGRGTITAFGAISSGKFSSQLIRGRQGMQGPYQLLGQ